MVKKGHRILIAEDNPLSSDILKVAIESLGHRAEIAETGEESGASLPLSDARLRDPHERAVFR